VSRAFFSKVQKIKMALKIDEEWIRQRVHLKHDNLGKYECFVGCFAYSDTVLKWVILFTVNAQFYLK
jgi:hypothetical protein